MKSKTKSLGLFLVLGIFSIVAAEEKKSLTPQQAVTFYAMGDVPYAPAEFLLLPKQISNLPKDAEFVVHLGDIKSGKVPCIEAVYQQVAKMLSQAAAPVFIIPGDNEWNDCTDPTLAWKYWNKHFMRFDQRWNHQLPVFRQLEREENFSWVKGKVLFIGLNIVGGRVHNPAEWKQRHADSLDWIHRNLRRFGDEVMSLVVFGHATPTKKHVDFFEPFAKEAQQFKKPILYLHGDGHRWIHDRPFAAKNILRVQVDQGGIAPPVKITVTEDTTNPFQFDRRNGKPAASPPK